MKKRYLLCIAMLLSALFCTSCSDIPKLEFTQAGIALRQDFETLVNHLSDEDMAIFEQDYPVYKIVKPKLDQKQMQKISALFGLSEEDGRTTELSEGYVANEKKLDFQSNTFFSYSYMPRGYENVPITTEDEALIQQATAFLQENGLLPDDFSYSGMAESTMKLGEISHAYEKIVKFDRKIDGHPVIGNSHIFVGFYQNAISSLSVAYNEYKEKKAVDTVPYEKAVAQLKQSDIIFEYDGEKVTGKPDTVELLEAEVVYVDHAYDNQAKYIQPAYRFRGVISDTDGHSSDFAAVVRAVAE